MLKIELEEELDSQEQQLIGRAQQPEKQNILRIELEQKREEELISQELKLEELTNREQKLIGKAQQSDNPNMMMTELKKILEEGLTSQEVI